MHVPMKLISDWWRVHKIDSASGTDTHSVNIGSTLELSLGIWPLDPWSFVPQWCCFYMIINKIDNNIYWIHTYCGTRRSHIKSNLTTLYMLGYDKYELMTAKTWKKTTLCCQVLYVKQKEFIDWKEKHSTLSLRAILGHRPLDKIRWLPKLSVATNALTHVHTCTHACTHTFSSILTTGGWKIIKTSINSYHVLY